MKRYVLACLAAVFACITQVQAQTVLTIDDPADAAEPLSFTLEALDQITQVEVKTENEFVDGLTTFTGPLAREVLEQIGATADKSFRFIAINEYEVTIPGSDLYEYDVILATRMNNEVISRRTKGPIWLMYPQSGNPELQDARVNEKLIWQVIKIEVQ